MFAYYKNLSLSRKIYIATVFGFLIGIFFGEKCKILSSINTATINIFQIAIIPYMILSIIHSVGSLSMGNARKIFKKFCMVLLSIWMISIFFAFCLRFSFPDIARSKFFRPEQDLHVNNMQLVDMFIPANPFHSIANGYIPAIVIFCLLVGAVLIRLEEKDVVVRAVGILKKIMNGVNDNILKLLPFGVLIMSAYTFGTINFTQLKSLFLYVVSSIFYLVFMSLVVYPGFIYALKGLSYKRFLSNALPPAIVAFTTGSVFLSLPVIYERLHELEKVYEETYKLSRKDVIESESLMNLIVPVAWVVPASYKFLVIFFIVFANWYYDYDFSTVKEIIYYIGGIPALFGSNSTIVPFLVNVSGIPNKAYDIFMIISSLMVYFNNANGAIFIVICTALTYLSIKGFLKINFVRLISFFSVATLFYLLFVFGIKEGTTWILKGNDTIKEELTHMNTEPYNKHYFGEIKAVYKQLSDYHHIPYLNDKESMADKIVRTKILQIGYSPEAIPFSFFNEQGKLVGYDIDFVYDIAKYLGCEQIEFYKIYNYDEYKKALNSGKDINMCVGVFLYRAVPCGNIVTSMPYMKVTPAIVLRLDEKSKYPTINSIAESKDLTFAVLAGSAKTPFREQIGKEGRLVKIDKFSEFYSGNKGSALLSTGEAACGMSIVYKNFWVYFYHGSDIVLFYAYLLPYHDKSQTFINFVNTGVMMSYLTGYDKKRYEYWVEGKVDFSVGKPWSVLEWLEKRFFSKSE